MPCQCRMGVSDDESAASAIDSPSFQDMTLLVSLSGVDGLVVATDSRGTFGDPRMTTAQNDSQKKLYVTTKYTAVLTAGAGEVAASLMADSATVLAGIEGVTPVMQALRAHIRTQYAAWFPNFAIQPVPNVPIPMRPDIAFIIVGTTSGRTTNRPCRKCINCRVR